MKGLATCAGAAAVVALGVTPVAGGQKMRNDDALDINGGPRDRAKNALRVRKDWAYSEYRASRSTYHTNNGDRSSAATFHKTLPHDEFGQVSEDDLGMLIECIESGSYDTCEAVPQGDESGFLINPLGGIAVDFIGPSSSAVPVPAAPALNSEDLAAQLAEVYWMSLTRDIPFSKFGEESIMAEAADNLAKMPGFRNMPGVAVDGNGRADPSSQLFRSTAVGVTTGPFMSQLLVKDFTIDSMTVTPQQVTYVPDIDYMTDYDEWLRIQNGGAPLDTESVDATKRYIRNGRDLSRLVYTDTIYTEAFRGAMVLLAYGAISKAGFNGPYADSTRQKGFVSFGVSHVMKILGSAEVSQRSSWYQKWNVHLFARPEAVGGTIHNVKHNNIDVEIHESLMDNEDLWSKVVERNAKMSPGQDATYLLSQAVMEGSPSHPSYPAGHAVQNGAFATVLKALVGIDRADECFSDPVYPDDEGVNLLPYDGDCLTYEGEINKMAVNIAFGRQMCGVHYRMDSEEGLLLGEIVGVRMLQQEAVGFPENAPYHFRLMSGQEIKLEADGSSYVDGKKCKEDAFMGAHEC